MQNEKYAMYELHPAYPGLREQAFAWNDPGLLPGIPAGLILETGHPQAVVTLVVLSEGAVSLYFSSGGGVIGAGAHQAPAEAAKNLLRLAGSFLQFLPAVTDNPVPAPGETRLYVLLGTEMRGVSGTEAEFGEGRSSFSPLFSAAQRVIFEVMRTQRT